MSSEGVISIVRRFLDDYMQRTPKRLKFVDAYLAYVMMTGIVQFAYCMLVGTFPFNSFLSGFISCVGSFVLAGTCGWSFLAGCVVVGINSNTRGAHQFEHVAGQAAALV